MKIVLAAIFDIPKIHISYTTHICLKLKLKYKLYPVKPYNPELTTELKVTKKMENLAILTFLLQKFDMKIVCIHFTSARMECM